MSEQMESVQRLLDMMERFLDLQDRMCIQLEKVTQQVQVLQERMDEQQGVGLAKSERLN